VAAVGNVEPGFERVRDIFSSGLGELGDGGGAFTAYVEGKPVVDLWGGLAAPGRPWAADTTAVMMSCSKGFSTMCAQILFDRGQLDIEAPVTAYWPEYGQNGKSGTLVKHLLTHTSGVLGFGDKPMPMSWDGTGWDDYDAIAAGLAAAAPMWEPGTRFAYHATSYGWLIGELVRRITGQTIGTFFHQELAQPLGLDIWIGTPPEEQVRFAPIINHITSGLPLPLRLVIRRAERQMRNPMTMSGQAFLADGQSSLMDEAQELLNNHTLLTAEFPAGNATATARSVARLYAMLAMGGELDGTRVVSSESVATFGAERIRMTDSALAEWSIPGLRWMLSRPVRRSYGYLINPAMPPEKPRFGPNPNAFGHDGAGGQIAFCDVENRISVGFNRNDLTSSSKLSTKLIYALYECAGVDIRRPGRSRHGVAA
jgi:CubicO group peptidase (beta-lactamase class C family)